MWVSTEDITQYAHTHVPLYTVRQDTSFNNLTKPALQNFQYYERMESNTFSESRELDSVEIEEFHLREPINFLKQSFDSQNYQQQQVIRKHFPSYCKPELQATQPNLPNQINPDSKSESRIILQNCSKNWSASEL